jgi:hypothetical protein
MANQNCQNPLIFPLSKIKSANHGWYCGCTIKKGLFSVRIYSLDRGILEIEIYARGARKLCMHEKKE